MTNNLSLRTNANHLLALIKQDPSLLVGLKPPKESVELTKKPKCGEKIHSGKPTYHRLIDYEAIDLKTDLERALIEDNYAEVAKNYYALAYLLSYY